MISEFETIRRKVGLRDNMMKRTYKIAATLLVAIFATFGVPDAGNAQSACEVYRVKPGDSLRKIALRAFGDDDYSALYQMNAGEIGRNPNLISVGMVLNVPCADGSAPSGAFTAISPVNVDNQMISFVTANGYLPYTDESLEGQGIFTSLVETAMLRSNPEQQYTVTFVNDWAAHLEALLPSMAFDASFPWSQPNCGSGAALSPTEKGICETYIYSQPFYEIVEGFFARNGSGYDELIDPRDMAKARFCRPEGYPVGHFAELGIWPEADQIVHPTRVASCFELLMKGQVDVVSLDTRSAAMALQAMGLSNQVSENKNIASIVPLQVAVHRANPDAEKIINQLNAGLRQMHESGEWRALISSALQIELRAGSIAMN